MNSRHKKANVRVAGTTSYLRLMKLSDASKDYVSWLNDKDVNQYLESRFSRATLTSVREYVHKAQKDPHTYLFAIIDTRTKKHIGNIKLGSIDWNHKFGELGFFIGDKSYWGKGYATEAIRLALKFAFSDLKLNKIGAGVYINNPGSIRVLHKLGFKEEGVQKKHFLYNGKYIDSMRFGKHMRK